MLLRRAADGLEAARLQQEAELAQVRSERASAIAGLERDLEAMVRAAERAAAEGGRALLAAGAGGGGGGGGGGGEGVAALIKR